ncbi:MAG: anthranilate synthase component I [Acidimicrobiia bacterium]
MDPSLTRAAFLEAASSHTVVPLFVEVLGDRETPVSLYERLAADGDGFLLESVEGGERWARWSFVGWQPQFTLLAHEGRSWIEGEGPPLPDGGDPLEVLEKTLTRFTTPPPADLGFPSDVPPLFAGAVGFFAYDVVRYVEHLPMMPRDDRGLPEMAWQFFAHLAIFDHLRQTVRLVRNVFVGEDPEADYDRAVADLAAVARRFGRSIDYEATPRPLFAEQAAAVANLGKDAFEKAVRTAIDHIEAGDAFQIVPSLRLEVGFDGDPFAVYRSLRLVNPSPFLFYLRQGDLAIAGSSPELMIRSRDGKATSRPIAGTRPRGATPEEDARLERDLLGDPKEKAEHVMLVDLARNDLGRVCEFGSVQVDELMVVERYSHVMHIVSGVSGALRPGVGPLDLVRATFPHGTVSGAPKVRAMEIIDDLEPTARGPYAGAVGYIDFSGNVDTAIALRTLVASGGKAWVQAGAGVVADSVPEREYEECLQKAAAVLAAIGASGDV